MTKEITLGCEVEDLVTGFRGIVVAETKFLNGCIRLAVSPTKLSKDGVQQPEGYIDIQQLKYIGPGIVKKIEENVKVLQATREVPTAQSGGDHKTVPRQSDKVMKR